MALRILNGKYICMAKTAHNQSNSRKRRSAAFVHKLNSRPYRAHMSISARFYDVRFCLSKAVKCFTCTHYTSLGEVGREPRHQMFRRLQLFFKEIWTAEKDRERKKAFRRESNIYFKQIRKLNEKKNKSERADKTNTYFHCK